MLRISICQLFYLSDKLTLFDQTSEHPRIRAKQTAVKILERFITYKQAGYFIFIS